MRPRMLSTLGLAVLLLCCSRGESGAVKAAVGAQPAPGAAPAAPTVQAATATFAGGCFWCMQPAYDHVPGVLSTTVGYTGGHLPNPTYEQVGSGGTGHRESIEVTYDPAKVTYDRLLTIFWHNIDPTDNAGQFCDHGEQYRSAIFYHDAAQRQAAEAAKKAIAAAGRIKEPIVTDILPASKFYPAEGYHQKYYVKSALQYKFYRFNCGRDRRLSQLWGETGDTGH
ncbi:MAG TPA: peptide-methionine (S)-S-oxide reductase MsrA [Thermoanaerobaculia bacterium]|nr:peptide-methionine (S)-S-oxide reductase MsrA [Thermoanaerobaculia bacterium]